MVAGLAGRGTRFRWQILAAISALAAAVALSMAVTAPHAAVAPVSMTASTSCQHAVGPFHVSGTEVIGEGGQVFIPYGITVPGLANANGTWRNTESADQKKIVAAADAWCANTVRLQVSQDNLYGPDGNAFDPQYLAAIESEVKLATDHHLVVVLNDQTETWTTLNYQRGPTAGTETFWKRIISAFSNNDQVIFDLFNEPRTYDKSLSLAQEWSLWHDGGTYQGNSYIGMAKLAADLRAADKRHLFWVEGPDWAATFAGMLKQGALLTTPDVVYAIHHPQGLHTQAVWHADFGYLAVAHIAPVVVGEWTNYRPWQNQQEAQCWKDGRTQVPAFLAYLGTNHIGMTAYQLAPGLLVTPGNNLASPTTIGADWTCALASGPTSQGAGALIMNWYRAQNG